MTCGNSDVSIDCLPYSHLKFLEISKYGLYSTAKCSSLVTVIERGPGLQSFLKVEVTLTLREMILRHHI